MWNSACTRKTEKQNERVDPYATGAWSFLICRPSVLLCLRTLFFTKASFPEFAVDGQPIFFWLVSVLPLKYIRPCSPVRWSFSAINHELIYITGLKNLMTIELNITRFIRKIYEDKYNPDRSSVLVCNSIRQCSEETWLDLPGLDKTARGLNFGLSLLPS